jgi:cysteine desulfurase
MPDVIYLDNSATTKVDPQVVEAMEEVFSKAYGNPSSIHGKGLESERLVEDARRTIGSFLKVEPKCIIFTSGGTESNNLAIRGSTLVPRRRGRHIITSKVEHPSVLNTFRDLEDMGFPVTYIEPDGEGIIEPWKVREALTDETILVSIMHVNNEVGAVEPIEDIAKVVKARGEDILFHVDAVQGIGKVPIFPEKLGIDLLSMSAHKLHGPKGVGALFVRRGVKLKPIITGGGQEDGFRSGTENVPGIVGFGRAVQMAAEDMEETSLKLMSLKERLIEKILSSIPDVKLNGPSGEFSAPHILNLSFYGVRAQVLVHWLETRGIFVSTGSACSSRKATYSHVLKAMGLKGEAASSAIRVSLSRYNTQGEMDAFCQAIRCGVAELRDLYNT